MPIKLLQITDCHLGEEEDGQLLGLNTDQSLQYVLQHMFAEQEAADLLICSGDLRNDHGCAGYQRLLSYLPADIEQAWLPGNHDDLSVMQQALGDKGHFLPSLTFGNWQVTLLDTSIPNEVPGLLGQSEFSRALEILDAHPDKSHLFFVHHHLHAVNCKWLDHQVVKNADEVLTAFAEYPQLKLIVCGHIHQDSEQQYQHIKLYSTPSTSIQFQPESDDFAVGYEMPGYRWFELYEDGSYKTAVSRIAERELKIDRGATGY